MKLAHIAVLALATLLGTGCAQAPSRVDPLEPMNRALYQFHDAVDTAVVKPIAQGYIDYMPQLIRRGVSNVFNNIDDLFSAINGLLQGKPDKAGDDLGRVLLNTMWGIGGLFDLASDLGIERGGEDFGQTLAVWGFRPGPYLFVPFVGPLTVRDGTGYVIRVALGPVGYVPDVPLRNSLYGLGAVDLRAQFIGAGELVDTAALDRYTFIRNAYMQRRRYLIYDGRPPRESDEEE